MAQVCDPALPRVSDAPGAAPQLLENGAAGDDPAGDAASPRIARRFGSVQAQDESGPHRYTGIADGANQDRFSIRLGWDFSAGVGWIWIKDRTDLFCFIFKGDSSAVMSISDGRDSDSKMDSSASEKLFNMNYSSLEEFYPAVAIAKLMRVVKDQTLSQHHNSVVTAVMFIFKSLGVRSVPHIKQVGLKEALEGRRESFNRLFFVCLFYLFC